MNDKLNLVIPKSVMLTQIRQMLDSNIGNISDEMIYELIKKAMENERKFAIKMCDYHINGRMDIKPEFKQFAEQIKNSIICGPIYTEGWI